MAPGLVVVAGRLSWSMRSVERSERSDPDTATGVFPTISRVSPLYTSRISGTVTVHEIKGNENHDATPSPSTNIMTYKFDPTADVTDLTGKVAIVTGGK